MTKAELTTAITALLPTTPEAALSKVYTYLKAAEAATEQQVSNAQNLQKILDEDHELLHRLAQ